jgi:hypothetical protein
MDLGIYKYIHNHRTASVVQWSEFLATDPEVRVLFPALPHFLRICGSGTGFCEMFSTACDSAPIISILAKYRAFSRGKRNVVRGQGRREGWMKDDSLLFKNSLVRNEVWGGAFLPRFAQNLMPIFCRMCCEISSGQIHDSNVRRLSQRNFL